MNETKLMILIIGIVCCVLIISFSSCMMHCDYRISKAIESGADPVMASWALGYERTSHQLAILELSRINREKNAQNN